MRKIMKTSKFALGWAQKIQSLHSSDKVALFLDASFEKAASLRRGFLLLLGFCITHQIENFCHKVKKCD